MTLIFTFGIAGKFRVEDDSHTKESDLNDEFE